MAVRSKSKTTETGIPDPEGLDPEDVVYVRNERGTVHSVTAEHFFKYLCQVSQDTGKAYPLPGWTVVDEDTAREENPQLFGAHDPRIKFTSHELTEQYKQRQILKELYANDAKGASAIGTDE